MQAPAGLDVCVRGEAMLSVAVWGAAQMRLMAAAAASAHGISLSMADISGPTDLAGASLPAPARPADAAPARDVLDAAAGPSSGGGEDEELVRSQLRQVEAELAAAREDLQLDEKIFAEQQRELKAAQAELARLQQQLRAQGQQQQQPGSGGGGGGGGRRGTKGDAVVVVVEGGGEAAGVGVARLGGGMGGGALGAPERGAEVLERAGKPVAAAGGAGGAGEAGDGALTPPGEMHDAQLELMAMMAAPEEQDSGGDGAHGEDVAAGSGEHEEGIRGLLAGLGEEEEEDVLLGGLSGSSSGGEEEGAEDGAAGSDEEDGCQPLGGDAGGRKRSQRGRRKVPRSPALLMDAEHHGLAAELAMVAAQRDALEQERAALEEAAQQQQLNFDTVREVLEGRMRQLSSSITAQEALIEALTAAEAQARMLNAACMVSLSTSCRAARRAGRMRPSRVRAMPVPAAGAHEPAGEADRRARGGGAHTARGHGRARERPDDAQRGGARGAARALPGGHHPGAAANLEPAEGAARRARAKGGPRRPALHGARARAGGRAASAAR